MNCQDDDMNLCTCKDLISYPCIEHAIRIDDWQLIWADKAAEIRYTKNPNGGTTSVFRLDGLVESKSVKTQPIKQSSGVFALATDGTWYLLGTPRQSWLKWLKNTKKFTYDAEDPLKIKGNQ